MKTRIAAAVLAGTMWLMATPAMQPADAQVSTAFDAVADAYTDASRPDYTHGGRATLRTDGQPVIDTFIRFDVQNVGTVPSATLRVFAETSNASGFEVHSVEDSSWDESLITAANAPSIGPVIAGSGPVTGGTFYDIDVSSAVSSDGPVAFALRSTSSTATRYSSREGANPPQLLAPSPQAAAQFVVSGSGSTYEAAEPTAGTTYSGTLESVVESAVGALGNSGGTIAFAEGVFDLGSDVLDLRDVVDVTFEGQGIDATVIQNFSDAAADTEPFSFTGSSGVAIRDLTVSAGGAARSTSDAVELDGSNDSLVERVKIISSRSRGIVMDGKDAGVTADGNVVRDCVIDGVPGDGIELLASSGNRIESCTIANVGGHGVQVNKASASADQPHKQSNDNVLSGNTIDQAGRDGVDVNSGARNQIVGNTITNSSDDASSRDGIRILSSNSVNCDDNVVDGNVARDDQDPRTQTYGLAITSALCHRTVVTDNDFRFNRVGEIKDLGTATDDGSGGTVPAEPPTEFYANGSRPFEVQLVWDTYADPANVGYTVYRDGEAIAVTGADENDYLDTTVSSVTTYEYEVDWFDSAGNHSERAALTITTPCSWSLPSICSPTEGSAYALPAEADAYVHADNQSSNYGSSAALRVDGSPDMRSYLRFRVNEVTEEVKRATLRVYANSTSTIGFDAHSVTDNTWDEQTISYANAPVVGDVIDTSGRFSVRGYVDVDVSSVVTGSGTYTIALTGRNATAISFRSREGNWQPELIIETGPPDPPPPSGTLYSDDFETGDLAQWDTDNGVVATQDVVRNGAWAVRATGTQTRSYASARMASSHDATYSLWFNVISQGANNVYLLQSRSGIDNPVMGVYITATGKLATRNHFGQGAGSKTTTADVGPGWHQLRVRVVTGDPKDSLIEVWLDDVKVVTRTDTLAADPMNRIEMGSRSYGTFDVAFDDVEVTAP